MSESRIRTYTPEQVAEILQMDIETVRRKMKSGEIPAVKIGGRWRIGEEELRRLLSGEKPKKED